MDEKVTIAYNVGEHLVAEEREQITAERVIEMVGERYAESYGSSNVAIIATTDLPADFSVDTYTIIDGQLVKAPAELIAERLAARRVADREAIRAERERRYQSEAIASLYWTWIESGVEADRSVWIAAKEAVRLELPYPETQEGGVQ